MGMMSGYFYLTFEAEGPKETRMPIRFGPTALLPCSCDVITGKVYCHAWPRNVTVRRVEIGNMAEVGDVLQAILSFLFFFALPAFDIGEQNP